MKQKMKGILIAAFIILAVICAMGAMAEDTQTFTSGDFEYVLDESGNAEIRKYSGKESNPAIPDQLDGHSVTGIGDHAFRSQSSLVSISIPDSVVSIGINPFWGCRQLTGINVSSDHPTLAVIDGVLFRKTDRTLICYPCAFKAEDYSIPQGIASIGEDAFFDCNSLASVSIPNSVTNIGGNAFRSCKSLASISIPDSVTSIGDSAFYDCNSLVSISIPDSAVSIGTNPFWACDQLTYIRVSPDHPTLAVIDGVLFRKTDRTLICYPCAFKAESYSIPQGITSIGTGAFAAGYRHLVSVSIPDSVTSIGDFAFSGCEGLVSVSIPESVTSIGEDAFSYCTSLVSISIPDSVTSIGDFAFTWCISLVSISIPDSVTSIGNFVFSSCKRLTSVSIPDSVTSIGDYAFSNCKSLTSISIPVSVTSIGKGALSTNSDTLTITVPRDSYAAQYCREKGFNYTYPDANDWLYN